MDPNETLRKLREAVKGLERDELILIDQELSDLFESFQALDEWLTKGGFLPSDWA